MSVAPLLLEHFDTLLATPADVELLNRAILTLAVQGKLVEQDPSDEPVRNLLVSMQAEKTMLGNIKSLPPINSSEKPFELPKGWEWLRLGDIIQITSGKNLTKGQMNEAGDIPVYGGNGITGYHDEALVHQKTIVIGRVGYYCGSVHLTEEKAWITDNAFITTFPDNLIYRDYLVWLLKGTNLKEDENATAQPVISGRKIFPIVVGIPPLAEQKRIVARVETLFAQTRALSAKLARAESELTHLNQSALFHLLAADSPEEFNKQWDFIAAHFESLFTRPEHVAPLRQSILELAVRGVLTRRAAGDESARELLKRIKAEKEKSEKKEVFQPVKESERPFALPEGWEWARLKQITLDLQTGPFGNNLHKSDYVSNGIPVVNPVNMRDGKIVALGKMMISEKTRERLSQYKLEAGDLVLARRGEIGRCALVTEKESGWLCGTGSLRMKLSENITKNFIVLLLKTDFARSRLTKETVGITMSNMSQTALENLIFALPPLAEQAHIVARVEQLLGLCEALESRLRAAQSERGRLVESVLSGISNFA